MAVVVVHDQIASCLAATLLKAPFEWLTLDRRRFVGFLRRKDANAARLPNSYLSIRQRWYANEPSDKD
jgi:hypothetical protein